jgi:uncharacterized protein (TIGR02145 family)
LTDARDNKVYRTVAISSGSYSQVWMAENLAYAEGATICQVPYGCYYTWAQVMNFESKYDGQMAGTVPEKHQGLCPDGWHLPSNAEWTTLTDAIGSLGAGTQLKASSGWTSDGNGTDEYGFSALPGGYYNGSLFDDVGNGGYWWSSTENIESPSLAYRRYMYSIYSGAGPYGKKSDGFSVRCIKN